MPDCREAWFQSEGSAIDSISFEKEPWDLERPTAQLVRELFTLESSSDRPKIPVAPNDDAQSYLIEKLKEGGFTLQQFSNEALARAQLHDESVHEIDYQITKAASSLDQFSHWGIGYNSGVDFKRNLLERELSNLRKERRNTLLRTWADIKALRVEFREALAEYKSLLNRLGLL